MSRFPRVRVRVLTGVAASGVLTGVALCCMLAGLAGVSASKSPTRIGSALAVAPATVAQTSAPAAATTTHKIIYDECALMIDGKRTYVWSGEFRYWRLPSPSL